MLFTCRLQHSLRAASIHLAGSAGVAAVVAAAVFGVWYPYPYQDLAGGRELFLLIAVVDVFIGPLVTFVVFDPLKSRPELLRDMGFVCLVQLAALGYGLHVVWQARPVYLVQEVDRFKVITLPMLEDAEVKRLPKELQPSWMRGPITVAIRRPYDIREKNKVLFEAASGGRDYAERAEFFLPYTDDAALKSLLRAKPLADFLQKQPAQVSAAIKLVNDKSLVLSRLMYLPVVGRQDWVAILDSEGKIKGFLKGDGF